ncbi:MAG: OsmC family protein [Candidatus Omnitrophota bacterium]|nr:OsmC family protein [Candidatus Omnitrophota bacterium]
MYHVDITNSGDYTFKAKTQSGDELTIGAKTEGINPLTTLLAGLGSCIGVYLRRFIEGTKLPIRDFSITLDAELVKESPMRFKEINISVDLKGARLDEGKKRAMLEFIHNCPAYNTLKHDPVININLKGV